jgi:prepilin-type N-terminal cleavage/methylation domain-containing protein
MNTRNGFTLVELMAAMAVGSITILFAMSMMVNSVRAATLVSSQSEKNELVGSIRRTLMDRRAIQKTIDNNPIMSASINSNYSGAITSINSNVYYGISLYDNLGERIAGPQAFQTVPESPVYYTEAGQVCTNPANSNCAYALTASYMVQGMARYGTPYDSAPTISYPSWNPNLKPEFFQVSFRLRSLKLDTYGVARKDITGSAFYDLEEWGLGVGP